MATFRVIPLTQLTTKIPKDLIPLVSKCTRYLDGLTNDQGGRIILGKGEHPKTFRKALKIAAASLNRKIRFPFRGEGGAISFYLQNERKRRKPRRLAGSKPTGKKGGSAAKKVG